MIEPDLTFDAFYQGYPKKTQKEEARGLYEKLSDVDKFNAIQGTRFHVEHNPQWRDKTFIPNPARFIRRKLWQDEPVLPRKEEIVNEAGRDKGSMVWAGMVGMFGQSWINKFGDRPDSVWRQQLGNITEKQILKGLGRVRDEGSEHPPSLPYFIQLCKAENLPEFRQLPRPEGDPALAEEAFAEMKRVLGIQ